MRQRTWMAAGALMRPVSLVPLAIAALLTLAAGGTYAAGICTRSSAGQQAAEQQAEARGGVYLRGQDTCAVGAGGP